MTKQFLINRRALQSHLRNMARVVAACLLMIAFTLPADAGLRCRDCPFPMKIGDNQWLMPDSSVVIEIYEQRLMDSSFQMSVSLLDANTGELLAAGSTRRSKTQRSVTITLIDPQGRSVDGEIKWVNFAKGMIQARFSCSQDSCSIQRRLKN